MDKEKLEEVREAVNQELPVLAALRTEREELSKRVRDMQIELDENKSLLTLSLMEGHMVHRALLDHKDDLRAAEKEQNAYKLALEKARQAGGTSADDRPATELDERLAQIAQLYQENQNLKQQLVDIEKVNDAPDPLSPLRIVKKDANPVDVFGTDSIPVPSTLNRQQYIADQERVVKEKQQQLESPSDQGRSDVAKSQAPALALSPDHGRPWASVGSSARPAAVASSEAAVSGPEAVSVPSRPAAPSAAPAAPPTAGHERWREAATLDTSASQVARPADPLALLNQLTPQILTLTTLLISRERIHGLGESQGHNHTHHHHSHHTHFHCQSPIPTPSTMPPQPCSYMHVHRHQQPPT